MDKSKETLEDIEEFIENRIKEIEYISKNNEDIDVLNRNILTGEIRGYMRIKSIIKKYK